MFSLIIGRENYCGSQAVRREPAQITGAGKHNKKTYQTASGGRSDHRLSEQRSEKESGMASSEASR
jgi:hypothetical protein